jgi:hypothetical protein
MFDDVPDFTGVMPVSGGGLGTGIIRPGVLAGNEKLHAVWLSFVNQT